jgi:HEAT repeat protein
VLIGTGTRSLSGFGLQSHWATAVSKQAFDKKMEALDSLRSSPSSPATLEQLRKALKDRNNYLASKAAALAGELGLQTLAPDLAVAFDRFFADPGKSDPQCWAKNAIAKALKDLGHDDPAIFIRGMKHFQPEGVWGGRSDSAATLRSVCALALAGCALDRVTILTHLVDLFADPEKVVRVDAARAVAQMPGPEAVLLLRLKALSGDRESEVTGQCFACLLEMSPGDGIPFVARFLNGEDTDLRLEAIAALGACPELEAVEILKDFWENNADPEIKQAILRSLGTSRQPVAIEFLLTVLDDGRPEYAAICVTALATGRFREEVRDRVAAAVKRRGEPKLTALFAKELGA